MSDFDDALKASLERNERLAEERIRAEEEMDQAAERALEAEERAASERREAQNERHAALAERLQQLGAKVHDAAPDVVVRGGWSSSGEEYLAKFSAAGKRPARSLTIELDRDDDEVLVRWHSGLGDGLELYHLLEFELDMLETLVLQVLDDELWSSRDTLPPFPGNRY